MEVGFFCSPQSFLAADIAIDLISSIIVFAIAIYAFRLYKTKKQYGSCKSLALFGTALLALGTSFLIRTITYFNVIISENGGVYRQLFVNTGDMQSILFICGFISYRVLTVLGFFIIYCIAFKKDSWLSKALVFLLLISNTVLLRYNVSQTFYLTTMLLLAIIALRYRQQYLVTKNPNTKCVAISFMLLSLSYLLIMVSEWLATMYIFSKLIWLGSFILLLWSFIRTLKDGKKKNKA